MKIQTMIKRIRLREVILAAVKGEIKSKMMNNTLLNFFWGGGLIVGTQPPAYPFVPYSVVANLVTMNKTTLSQQNLHSTSHDSRKQII